MPRHLIIGTAGHIDHGKSALVLALTGTDPDRLKEEKARGITIDLGFAHWTTDEFAFSFVDVPGHERFVKNMLAGVGGIDAVVLVVAADESVMPQTREHFEICRLLGVPAGLIAMTKADLADEDTLELVAMEVRDLVAGSFLADAPVIAVSARNGDGLAAFREALVAFGRRSRSRSSSGIVRMPIDRAFSVRGFGTVVTGTLLSGRVGVDDELALLPGDRRVKVRGVQVHGETAALGQAGQRVALNLGGIDLDEIGRGDSLLTPGTLTPTRMLDARLQVVSSVGALRHGARVRFHQGTSETLGRVAVAVVLGAHRPGEADRLGDIAAGPGAGASEVPGGADAYVRLRLEAPAVLSRGDRFILRAYSPPVTVAGGVVLDPHPARGAIRTEAARARFERLDPGSAGGHAADDRAVSTFVAEAGAAGFDTPSLVSRAGLDPGTVDEVIGRLVHAGSAVRAGAVLLTPAAIDALASGVLKRLTDHHRAEPLSEGMPREEVRERIFARAGEGVFDAVIARLQQDGTVVGRDRLALASHRVSLTPEEEQARQVFELAFRTAGLKPPDLREVAQAHGIRDGVQDRVVKLLVRQKTLARLDTMLFHQEALDALKRDLGALKAAAPDGRAAIDVGTFKERYGLSRKYAIPLLEYLDRERLTRRVGDVRQLV
jgi:selenocysteine-specific elongation factor